MDSGWNGAAPSVRAILYSKPLGDSCTATGRFFPGWRWQMKAWVLAPSAH